METIKNYLETMFSSLPDSFEVKKAKYELWQMMEDKYTELINEGKTDNEAIGIVISEFGNLDELAEDLGIKEVIVNEPIIDARPVTLELAKAFIADRIRYGVLIAIGVFLCITSVCGLILSEEVGLKTEAFGLTYMFLSIAIAVGLFVYSGMTLKKWSFLEEEPCSLDYATANYIKEQRDSYRGTHALLITIGVILCVASVLPAALLDELISRNTDLGGFALFIFVGAAVLLFVATCYRNGSYDILLNVNTQGTMGGSYARRSQKVKYADESIGKVMEFYWPTITCIYLIWSFLTFQWWKTWLIWPIAGICHSVIVKVWEEK